MILFGLISRVFSFPKSEHSLSAACTCDAMFGCSKKTNTSIDESLIRFAKRMVIFIRNLRVSVDILNRD